MALVLSEIESEIFKCKAARFETDVLKTNNFQQQLIDNSIDFCRLKVNSANLKNYSALAQLSMPNQFCGSILKYKMDFFKLPKPAYKNKGLAFEVYNPISQQDILCNLIENTFITDPIGYYKNHLLSTIITKQQEVKCMAHWYVKHCDDSQNKMILMKIGDQYIGYISIFQKESNLVNTPIAGVLPKYQGQKMFDDLRTYRHLYCLQNHIKYGTAGARIENNYSQQTFINDGMQQISNEAIYIVTPFLNKNDKILSIKTKNILPDNTVFKSLNEQLNIHFLKDYKIKTYTKKSLFVKHADLSDCSISMPVCSNDRKMVVVKYYDNEQALCLLNWFES